MIVIADTAPINYLVLIGEPALLPALFGQVIVPATVFRELQATATPSAVAHWLSHPPPWFEVRQTTNAPDRSLAYLGEGEREAIQLAEELEADLLLVDEKAARREAAKRQLATSGTLGILDRAAEKGLIDFTLALSRLKETSFYLSPAVEQFFLAREAQRKASQPPPQA